MSLSGWRLKNRRIRPRKQAHRGGAVCRKDRRPKGLDWEDETALAHILTHEYIHIRYLDGLTKLVLTGTLCVHWWNPAVWLMVAQAVKITGIRFFFIIALILSSMEL